MKNNAYLCNYTIYQTDLNFVYQYGYVHPLYQSATEKSDRFWDYHAY